MDLRRFSYLVLNRVITRLVYMSQAMSSADLKFTHLYGRHASLAAIMSASVKYLLALFLLCFDLSFGFLPVHHDIPCHD